jgi:hypothetical protein
VLRLTGVQFIDTTSDTAALLQSRRGRGGWDVKGVFIVIIMFTMVGAATSAP